MTEAERALDIATGEAEELEGELCDLETRVDEAWQRVSELQEAFDAECRAPTDSEGR